MALINKYIEEGTPTGTETGDFGDAYRASNAEEFDEIMRIKLNAEGYHIHIAAGTYFTYGPRHTLGTTEYGWHVRAN